MLSRIAFLRKDAAAARANHDPPLEIVVSHTNPVATAQVLEAAVELRVVSTGP
jgi:hypothetical protein